MQKIMTLGSAIALSLVLAACGGGGSGGSTSANNGSGGNQNPTSGNNGSQPDEDNVTMTDSEVITTVSATNINFMPGTNGRPAGTWRWSGTPAQHVSVYIPAPAAGNSTEQDYAAKAQNAISIINGKLTGLLALEAVTTAPTSGNYIQVSYSTSYVPVGSTDWASFCANVSTGPNLANVISPDSQNGIATTPVYLNLGNGHCNVTQDIVTHEFGHALGLANHFNGFGGDGPSISTAYWDVLATLYGNPQSTVASSLIVKRAAN